MFLLESIEFLWVMTGICLVGGVTSLCLCFNEYFCSDKYNAFSGLLGFILLFALFPIFIQVDNLDSKSIIVVDKVENVIKLDGFVTNYKKYGLVLNSHKPFSFFSTKIHEVDREIYDLVSIGMSLSDVKNMEKSYKVSNKNKSYNIFDVVVDKLEQVEKYDGWDSHYTKYGLVLKSNKYDSISQYKIIEVDRDTYELVFVGMTMKDVENIMITCKNKTISAPYYNKRE